MTSNKSPKQFTLISQEWDPDLIGTSIPDGKDLRVDLQAPQVVPDSETNSLTVVEGRDTLKGKSSVEGSSKRDGPETSEWDVYTSKYNRFPSHLGIL